jgi:flavorubredoxin
MIAPDHGVIWRGDPMKIVGAYDRWSRYQTRDKALVVYDTMWKSTEQMARAVNDGIQDVGLETKLINLDVTHRSDVVTELMDAGGVVFGSPTFNNHLLPRMADMLYYLKGLKFCNRAAASFGSYGWSGEAVKQMNEFLEAMKMDLVDPGVRINFVPNHDGLKQCHDLGVKVGEAVKAKLAQG